MKAKKSTLSNKLSIIAIFMIVLLAVGILAGGAVFNDLLEKKGLAEITNLSSFDIISSNVLQYNYDEKVDSLNFDSIIEVSKGATFDINKIIDQEDITISTSRSKVVSLREKEVLDVNLEVVSANSENTTSYTLVLVPKSQKDNKIIIDNNIFDAIYYKSDVESFQLPTMVDKYYDHGNGEHSVNEFLGWFTDESYTEESKLVDNMLPINDGGEVQVFAKYADFGEILDEKNEFTGKFTYGTYPQTLVSHPKLNKQLTDFAKNNGIENGNRFAYNGATYIRFRPTNGVNLALNGYSSSQNYFFEVEPIVWRILQASPSALMPGVEYEIIADKILYVGNMGTDLWGGLGGTIYDVIPQNYREIAEAIGAVDWLFRYIYDPDTVWSRCNARDTLNDQFYNATVLGDDFASIVQKREYNAYNVVGSTDGELSKKEDTIYLPNFSDVTDEDKGFNPDYTAYDSLRRAVSTDYARANGVYVSTDYNHEGYSTWWLRSSGKVDDFEDRSLAYVKYTGYVHAYGYKSTGTKSGLRPTMTIKLPE